MEYIEDVYIQSFAATLWFVVRAKCEQNEIELTKPTPDRVCAVGGHGRTIESEHFVRVAAEL